MRTFIIAIVSCALSAPVLAEEPVENAEELEKTYESTSKTDHKDKDGRVFRYYEYKGEKFKVFEPKDGSMPIEAKGLRGRVYLHQATGLYRGEALGWGAGATTPDHALHIACDRIIDRAGRPSEEQLRKGLDELYESFGKPRS